MVLNPADDLIHCLRDEPLPRLHNQPYLFGYLLAQRFHFRLLLLIALPLGAIYDFLFVHFLALGRRRRAPIIGRLCPIGTTQIGARIPMLAKLRFALHPIALKPCVNLVSDEMRNSLGYAPCENRAVRSSKSRAPAASRRPVRVSSSLLPPA